MDARYFNYVKWAFDDQSELSKDECIKQLIEDHGQKFCDELKRQGHCDSTDCKKHGWIGSY
jgi:hypothetical protein